MSEIFHATLILMYISVVALLTDAVRALALLVNSMTSSKLAL